MNADKLQLKKDLLALPTNQRAFLAQELWGSLGEEPESGILDEAERRHHELSNGQVVGRTHDHSHLGDETQSSPSLL